MSGSQLGTIHDPAGYAITKTCYMIFVLILIKEKLLDFQTRSPSPSLFCSDSDCGHKVAWIEEGT